MVTVAWQYVDITFGTHYKTCKKALMFYKSYNYYNYYNDFESIPFGRFAGEIKRIDHGVFETYNVKMANLLWSNIERMSENVTKFHDCYVTKTPKDPNADQICILTNKWIGEESTPEHDKIIYKKFKMLLDVATTEIYRDELSKATNICDQKNTQEKKPDVFPREDNEYAKKCNICTLEEYNMNTSNVCNTINLEEYNMLSAFDNVD
jgi:hypothetical protein